MGECVYRELPYAIFLGNPVVLRIRIMLVSACQGPRLSTLVTIQSDFRRFTTTEDRSTDVRDLACWQAA
jgi:hypothetical protein